MKLFFENASEYISGIELIKEDLYFDIANSEADADCVVNVTEAEEQKIDVVLKNKKASITFGKDKVKLFRGLMLLSEALSEGKDEFSSFETPYFKNNGLFLDLARNAALNVESLKYFLRKSAVMGMNTLTFYLEDMFEVEGYPYFGYMRGRYSKAQLKELCVYGEKLGVEIIPYVEFFGHMEKFFGYLSSAPYRSDARTFLIGSEPTYKLIEDMVRSLRESFLTNKICVGGDEVFEANKGVYQEINGVRPIEDVFFEHANAVYDIAVKYGFKPFLSNDMYFYFQNNYTIPDAYYCCVDTVDFDEEIKNKVPENMGKIFWNYIEQDEDKMVRLMNLSKKLGGETMWLGSARMWQSLCVQYTPTLQNATIGINACKRSGIDVMSFCTFEDSGEVSHFLVLPALLVCAQLDYSGNYDEEEIQKKVKFLLGTDFIDYLEMERVDFIHQNGHTEFASKYLLYNDPLIGLLDKEIEGMDLKSYYHKLLCDYENRGNGTGPIKLSFDQFKGMISVLELKADFGLRLKAAYDSDDREMLKALADEALEIINRYEKLMNLDREMFTKYYIGFGSEKFEMRKGTMIARFKTVRYRIEKYLAGEIEKIDELEEEKLRYDHCRFDDKTGVNIYFSTRFEKILTEA